jgi:hypothetical protein
LRHAEPEEGPAKRAAAREALRTLRTRSTPPFGGPRATSIDPTTVVR